MSDELTETDPRASGKIYKIYEISPQAGEQENEERGESYATH